MSPLSREDLGRLVDIWTYANRIQRHVAAFRMKISWPMNCLVMLLSDVLRLLVSAAWKQQTCAERVPDGALALMATMRHRRTIMAAPTCRLFTALQLKVFQI